MATILVSMTGAGGSRGALGVFEPGRGLRHVQVEAVGGPVRSAGIRGMAVAGDRLYAVTQASLRVYALERSGLLFRLEREIMRPDWVIGGLAQGDLKVLAVAPERDRLFVGSNRLGAVDELTLAGEFVRRRHLWEISPETFPLPATVGREFRFARIRGMGMDAGGRLLLTLADCNGSGRGMILDGDGGGIVLDGLRDPIGAAFAADRVYVIDAGGLELRAHAQDGGAVAPEPLWTAGPALPEPRYAPAAEGLRGLALCGDAICCGVGNFRRPIGRRIASSILSFDARSGAPRGDWQLPDLREFRWPKVNYLAGVADRFDFPAEETTALYMDGQRGTAEPWSPPPSAPEPWADGQVTVNVENAGVCYRRHAGGWFGNDGRRDFWALRNVSFTIREGEVVGIIGGNGSGKSTLCMLLAGTMQPDEGSVAIRGRAQLLALGVGFQVDLTGRENVYISGTLLGLSRRQVAEQIDQIIEFSDLAEFIDEPVRTYSAGMRSRLGFAIATVVEPEILLLDEVMGAGDQSFMGKAAMRLKAMRARAKTVIMVSHNLMQLKKLTRRVLWLDRGRLLMDGRPDKVLAEYNVFSRDRGKWLAAHPELVGAPAPVVAAGIVAEVGE